MQCGIAPVMTGNHGLRTRGLKLVRGISTSHYLVATVHLTHRSLGELQSTGHHEPTPQSKDVTSIIFQVHSRTILLLKQT